MKARVRLLHDKVSTLENTKQHYLDYSRAWTTWRMALLIMPPGTKVPFCIQLWTQMTRAGNCVLLFKKWMLLTLHLPTGYPTIPMGPPLEWFGWLHKWGLPTNYLEILCQLMLWSGNKILFSGHTLPLLSWTKTKLLLWLQRIQLQQSITLPMTLSLKSIFEMAPRQPKSQVNIVAPDCFVSQSLLVSLGIQETCKLMWDHFHIIESVWPTRLGPHYFNENKPLLKKLLSASSVRFLWCNTSWSILQPFCQTWPGELYSRLGKRPGVFCFLSVEIIHR